MNQRFKKIISIYSMPLLIFGNLCNVYCDEQKSFSKTSVNSDSDSMRSYNVTIGSQFEIRIEDIPNTELIEFTKKPNVYTLENSSKKSKAKVLTNTYPSTFVTCEWKKKKDAGTYSLYVQPKGKSAQADKVTDNFNLKAPETDVVSVRSLDTASDSNTDSKTVEVELAGRYFSSKKLKVYFEYLNDKGKTKKKNFRRNSQQFDATTGASIYKGTVKKLPNDVDGDIIIESKIGNTSENLDTGNITSKDEDIARTWEWTGSLAVKRDAHTATLLSDGNVLIVGGYASYVLDSVEIYDPDTGEWSEAASLNEARSHHTATLLPSGNVLVTGGNVDDDQLASVEIYNPTTNVWTLTTPLSVKRQDHTASLLLDGTVLITGGVNGYGDNVEILDSTEIFNPESVTWNDTGKLNKSRFYHSATRLLDGTVMVAGGEGPDGLVAESELYDPTTGTWTLSGSLNQTRHNHPAILLNDGTVMVAGGVYGTVGDYTYIDSVEIYNSDTGTWDIATSLNTSRGLHCACLLPSGLVLVAGGEHATGNLKSTELYNPETEEWIIGDDLHTSRVRYTLTVLQNGKPLATGGYNEEGVHSSAELF